MGQENKLWVATVMPPAAFGGPAVWPSLLGRPAPSASAHKDASMMALQEQQQRYER